MLNIGNIKISREQATAIERWLEKKNGDKAQLLDVHAQVKYKNHGWSPGNPYASFNGLSQADMARALLIGYDIEEKYKVDDWVTVEWFGGSSGTYKVLEVLADGQVVIDNTGPEGGNTTPRLKFVRHSTPEEIKAVQERRIWKSIGREVGEFKIGDAGMHEGEVVRVRTSIDKLVISIMYKDNELEGFYPAESFISFEEGDEV